MLIINFKGNKETDSLTFIIKRFPNSDLSIVWSAILHSKLAVLVVRNSISGSFFVIHSNTFFSSLSSHKISIISFLHSLWWNYVQDYVPLNIISIMNKNQLRTLQFPTLSYVLSMMNNLIFSLWINFKIKFIIHDKIIKSSRHLHRWSFDHFHRDSPCCPCCACCSCKHSFVN